jgi:molecular chaperone GrpE
MSMHENPAQEPAAGAQAAEGAPAPAASTEDVMTAAAARVAALEAELAEMKDRWVRAEAETQNVRHRTRREVDEARQYAIQGFARDVAEAAENLRRGLDAMPPAGGNEIIDRLREGFIGVERSFVGLLERNGIKGQDPTGAVFDPNLHQAMAEQESADHPPGTIIQAWTQAWTLNGRLLRPAMVVVAKAPTAALPEAGGTPGQKLDTTA